MIKLINKKCLSFIILCLYILFNSYTNILANTFDTEYVYFYKEEDTSLSQKSIPIVFENSSVDYKINFILNYFLTLNDAPCVPEGTKLLDVYNSNGNIYLNFNSNIRNHGGNYYESVLLHQLFLNTFSVDGVNTVTIIIDGMWTELPEGQEIHFVTGVPPIQ